MLTRNMVEIRGNGAMKLSRQLFCPYRLERRGEGGLRTKGYFKRENSRDRHSEGKTSRPLVTIITAVFNGEKLLEQSILSVLNQAYDNVEYIIIDGGSTDGTLDIIRKYESAIDYWLSEPDMGIYDAWNKGIGLAGGDWIAFLGADDAYVEGALIAYIDLMNAYQNRPLDYVSSRVDLVSARGRIRTVGDPWNWNTFRKYMNVAHVGSFHSLALFEKYGLYDTSYKICGDYELLLRPGRDLRAAYFNKITVNMGIGGKADNSLESIYETARARETTGRRNPLCNQLDKAVAITKWRLRKCLSS